MESNVFGKGRPSDGLKVFRRIHVAFPLFFFFFKYRLNEWVSNREITGFEKAFWFAFFF